MSFPHVTLNDEHSLSYVFFNNILLLTAISPFLIAVGSMLRLVPKLNGIEFVCFSKYISKLPLSAYTS